MKFDGWPRKTIGHLCYPTSSFVHHFVAIGEFELELQSGNAQSGQIRRFLEPCDLEIWRMTLKNNRAPLLSNIKLYASFHHHMWIQTGVTVRKRLSWVVTSVTLTFDLWPWPFAWTLLWSLVIPPENFMMIRWWEHSQKGVTDRRTDGQTDRRTDGRTENTICRAAWSQLKIGSSKISRMLIVILLWGSAILLWGSGEVLGPVWSWSSDVSSDISSVMTSGHWWCSVSIVVFWWGS